MYKLTLPDNGGAFYDFQTSHVALKLIRIAPFFLSLKYGTKFCPVCYTRPPSMSASLNFSLTVFLIVFYNGWADCYKEQHIEDFFKINSIYDLVI